MIERLKFLLFTLSLSAYLFITLETRYLLKKGVSLLPALHWSSATSFLSLTIFFLLFTLIQSLWLILKKQHYITRFITSPWTHLLMLSFFILVYLIEWTSKKYLSNESFQRVYLISSYLILILFSTIISIYWIQKLITQNPSPPSIPPLKRILHILLHILLLSLSVALVIKQEWIMIKELTYPRWGLAILTFCITTISLYFLNHWRKINTKIIQYLSYLSLIPLLSLISLYLIPSDWVKNKRLETLSLAGVCTTCDFYYKKNLKIMNQQQVNIGTCDSRYQPWKVIEKKEANPELPDIIFVTIDALRQDQTSLYDTKIPYTPELLKLAQNAVVFDQAYSPSVSTRQSIKGIFTGVYSSLSISPSAKRWALSIDDQQETLAHYLQSAGYYTTALITAKGTFNSQGRALLGFDEIDVSLHWTYKNLKYVNPYQIDKIIGHFSNPQRRPHFLWTHILDSHQPYAVSPLLPKSGESKTALYHTVVSQIDQNLKRLIDFVQSPERKNRTWLIITADHGQSFNEHGQGAHIHGFSTYQEEIHVPLLIYGPNTKGMRIKTPVQLIDLFPTIFEMVGLPTPQFSCGQSLMPLIRGDELIPSTLLQRGIWVEQHSDHSRQERSAAYLWNDYKLVFSTNAQKIELFHLPTDPKEKNDLSLKNPEIFEQIKKKCIDDMSSKKIEIQPYMSW